MNDLITDIASDIILDQAYQWLCKRREKLSHNNDVWELRRHWHEIKPQMQQTLLQGEYMFSPLDEVRLSDGALECWCAADSLVLKAMALVLGKHLVPVINPTCIHVTNHGGAKKGVRDVFRNLSPGCHVMKSDVKSYYASIDHMLLFDALTEYVDDRYVLRLLWQYITRSVCYGENYREVTKGISLGCPLSPLMAALFLKPLDTVMEGTGLFYVRFMDDWIVIAPSRWKLRKAVTKVNDVLNELRLEKHPDKTFIGKATRGFAFLGYFLTPWGISVAEVTWKNMQKRIARLYEQGAIRIGQYVTRWVRWVHAGVKSVHICIGLINRLPTHEFNSLCNYKAE